MLSTELDDIKTYWLNKYPFIEVKLWNNEDETKYFGQMIKHDSNINFQADTVGELINLGEQFLRKVT